MAISYIVPVVVLMLGGQAPSPQTAPPKSQQTQDTDVLAIEPATAMVCAGDVATFTAKAGQAALEDVEWTIDPEVGTLAQDKGVAKYTAPAASSSADGAKSVAAYGTITLKASRRVKVTSRDRDASTSEKQQTAIVALVLGGLCSKHFGGELARVTVGYEQVGAASTTSAQKYSFEFFISRPLPLPHRTRRITTKDGNTANVPVPESPADYYFGSKWRWWGDTRLGSYPQQITASIAQGKTALTSAAGQLKVNKLVQTAEFMTGPEVRIAQFPAPVEAAAEASRQRFALTALAGIGGIGPFEPSGETTVFTVPTDKQSPQFVAFNEQYPNVTSKYVAFVPDQSTRFAHQWGVGARLYTFYADESAASEPLQKAPAMVQILFGTNRLAAPTGTTWHVSAYYPFPLGDRKDPHTLIVYLYGDAVMRFRGSPRDTVPTTFSLPVAKDASGGAIPLTDPDVTIIPGEPNARDTYRIGLSLDLIRVWDKLTSKTAETSAPAGKKGG